MRSQLPKKMPTMENLNTAPRLPRKRRSLAQELVTVLSEQIRDGLLKRGDKLPTESAIMEAHGVSRTVVREAISRLQAAGQVETRHGIGTFVLDTPSPSGFRIDPATVVTLRDVLAILELRISLEVESAVGLWRVGDGRRYCQHALHRHGRHAHDPGHRL